MTIYSKTDKQRLRETPHTRSSIVQILLFLTVVVYAICVVFWFILTTGGII